VCDNRSTAILAVSIKGKRRCEKIAEEQNNSRKDAKAQRAANQTKEFPFTLFCAFA
jgi:hypothetical protein